MDFKRTKIICTIGPSTWDPEIMRKMIEAGMNCARVNGAFADHDEMVKVTTLVKNASSKVGLMIDTKGSEIRLNKFEEPIPLKSGDVITIGSTKESRIYPANNLEVFKFLNTGQIIRVGDGDVELEIIEIKDGDMICQVKSGEVLKPAKALNFPGARIPTIVLTSRDRELIRYAKELGWDFVSASFINNVDDVRVVNAEIAGSDLKLIAKIENEQGVKNLDEILPEVYGIMIARGGLGVELGLENVPKVQDEIIRKCIKAKKTVITATQFLESMIENPRPTRAEVDDVANCIQDRSDVVMLSGETSAGKYPLQAVEMVTKIALATEPTVEPLPIADDQFHRELLEDSVIKSAAQFCINTKDKLDLVVAVSKKGGTARLLGKYDVKQPIVAFVSEEKYARYLSIDKGIASAHAFTNNTMDHEETIRNIVRFGLEGGMLTRDLKVLMVISGKSDTVGFTFPSLMDYVSVADYLL